MSTVTIPTFKTERLILRAPMMADVEPFAAFLHSDRARYLGGPGRTYFDSARAWGHATGLWVLRGFGPHTFCLRDGTPIGHGGPWFPAVWPEPEFGWSLWDGAHEGKGYVTEAMRALMPWAWEKLGLSTAVAYIHPDNAASKRVAAVLGGVLDPEAAWPEGDPALVFRFHAPGRRAAA